MRIGPVLEVTTSFQHFKYGIEIRIESVSAFDATIYPCLTDPASSHMLVLYTCLRIVVHLTSLPSHSRWLKSLSAKQVIHVTIHAHNLSNMVAERGRPRIAGRIVDVLVPLVMEEIVEEINAVPWEQIYERIRKQIVDAYVSQIAEQDTEVPKTPSRDRTLQCAAEQIPNVPVPEMVEQLVEVPETISQDRIQQRTVEQIVDFPVPQVVEELMEVSHVFLQDRVHQRFVEQIIEAPAISLDEQIVEVPVIQTPEKTQQLVNTHVQHVVDTVEVEKPKITELTVQRKKPNIQEKINQVTKHIKIPQAQFLDKANDMLVDVQRQIPVVQTMQKTMEVPLLQFTDKAVDNPVVVQRQISTETVHKSMLQDADKVVDVPVVLVAQVPHVHVVAKTAEKPQLLSDVQAPQAQIVEKTVEEPQSQIVEKTAETPEIQMVRGTETSESSGIAPTRQMAHA